MSNALESLRTLTDEAVVRRVHECVSVERRATAALIATLSEFDVRRLYHGEGFASLFDYCTRCLHLSERAACSRIAAARLSRRFPLILDLIADSSVSLTVVSLLAKHLNEANHQELLHEVTHKTTSEVEIIVARLAPKPDAPAMVRRVPDRHQPDMTTTSMVLSRGDEPPAAVPQVLEQATSALVDSQRPAIKPLAPERFKIQFTISGEIRAKLRLTQDLLRHSHPAGDLEAIFDRALSALLADLEKKKLALVAKPRTRVRAAKKSSRLIPAAVRRAVWARDKGRCAFVGNQGRCRERGALEFHHVVPFAAGGAATVENIQLRCRAHNAHEADLFFGPRSGS